MLLGLGLWLRVGLRLVGLLTALGLRSTCSDGAP